MKHDNGTYLAIAALGALIVSSQATRSGSARKYGQDDSDDSGRSRRKVIEEILDRVELKGRARRGYRRQLEAMTLKDLREVYETVFDITQEVDLDRS